MTVFHKITHNFSHNFAKTKVICKCKYDKPSRFHLKEKKKNWIKSYWKGNKIGLLAAADDTPFWLNNGT